MQPPDGKENAFGAMKGTAEELEDIVEPNASAVR